MANLLARIQSEVGPAAKVVSADKVRRGGMGGFFTKETYEILVEVPEGVPADGPSVAMAAPEPALSRRGGGRLLLGRLGGLGGAVPDGSATKSSFEDVLRGLIETSEPGPAAAAESGTAPLVTDPLVPATIPGPGADLVAIPAGAGPIASLPAGSDEDLSDLLALAVGAGNAPAEDARRAPDGEFETAEDWLSERGPSRAASSPVRKRPAARASRGSRPTTRRASLPPARLRSSLRALGVPTTFIPPDSRRGLVAALVRSLAELPEAPSADLEAGDVLAVVGCPQKAPRLAARLAMTLGLDPAALPAASVGGSPAEITSAEAARRRATEWSGGGAPTVLWVDAPMGSGREAWALRVLEALEPKLVWGVVDATRKPEDVKAWAGAVGGLDAIAVEELDATTTPASVLSVGVPVVLADGRRSTPELWAALLADRLAQQVA